MAKRCLVEIYQFPNNPKENYAYQGCTNTYFKSHSMVGSHKSICSICGLKIKRRYYENHESPFKEER